MNIAMTSLYLPGGSKIGVGYQVHAMANAMVDRGHQVTVFSACPSGAGAKYSAVQVEPLRQRWRTFAFAWDLRSIEFGRYDVLNAHGDDWFLWGIDRPYHVHTFHGSCLAEAIHATTWTGRMRMATLAACETQAVLLADDTVAVSETTRRYIPRISHIIPCGVDTNAFHPGEKSLAPSILFVGTLHGRKRGQSLLDLFRSTVRERISNAELWCVCESPADELDGDGVRWLGRVPHEQLTALFRSAWVFCLPSTYEGFGVPYIEAMASGTAVVASRNEGSIEVTEDGRWGRLVTDKQLAQTLIDLLQDVPARKALEEGGLDRSRAFSWETICSRYEKVYSQTPSGASPQ